MDTCASLAGIAVTRRSVLQGMAAVVAAIPFSASASASAFSGGRPAPGERKFSSTAVESVIAAMKRKIADPQLGEIFERCFPNTLDTTVFPETLGGAPDTFVITGDIEAMWLRDSSAQIWPYLRFARQDKQLAALIEGVVRRQARMVLLDPYANAFTRNTSDRPLKWAVHDDTEMKPGVAERKWEIDSLCYVSRLAHGYWKATGDTKPFDSQWKAAAYRIVQTFREQQRLAHPGPYYFARGSHASDDVERLKTFGPPGKPVGLIFSMFRPSDDACVLPMLIPSNLFAVESLKQLRTMAANIAGDTALAAECDALIASVSAALARYGHARHPAHGEIWAYEADGFGNVLMMDDANAPGLLSLAYLGVCDVRDPLYQRTRAFALSASNPYFFKGSAAEGIGGPHVGPGYVWPLSIIMRALTSTDDGEILRCLHMLRDTTGGTGFMHEAFQKDDPGQFTRPWFSWANGMFGELLLKLADTKPALLRQSLA
jgi:uncharacterized protein